MSFGERKQIRKRAPRMTLAQATHLANFILKNRDLTIRTPKSEDGDKKKRDGWRRLTMELNSLHGATKKVDGWKKAWLDLKRTSKLRVTKQLNDNRVNNIDLESSNISELDRKVLEATGIILKIGRDNYTLGEAGHDDELTFVEVKESDDSVDYLATEAADDHSLDGDNMCQYEDVKEEMQESGNYKRCPSINRPDSSCSEESSGSGRKRKSNDIDDEPSVVQRRKGKKKTHMSKIERALMGLQEDYTKSLQAIAAAINKLSDNGISHHSNSKPKRILQPWFHYLKFDHR